jgi:putative DNA primase/helicase
MEPKNFIQARADGNGGWICRAGCMKGVRLVPYRLPAVIAAVAAGRTIHIAEGEKGVHALESIGLVGTCSPGGAGKWREQYNAFFTGADVISLPDNDPQAVNKHDGTPRWHPDGRPVLPGQDHAADVASHLRGVAGKVRIVMLPNLPLKGDVADWVAAGGTAAELAALAAATAEAPLSNGKDHSEPPFDKSDSPSPPADETAIQVRPGELHILATRGEAALCSSGLPIFQRGHSLVQPVTTEVPASNDRTTIASGLADLTLPAMLDKLSQAAVWKKWNVRRKELAVCDPPDNVAKIILSRAGFWHVPPIAGIITAPTLRSDGSILKAPGYDPSTRLYHAVDPTLRRLDMPQRPTRADADRALVTLRDLLTGFPFCTAVDVAVALSAMITPVVRGALAVAPMHAFRAPTAGTGKSYLVDLIGVIATGRISPAINVSGREEEAEKRLAGMLLAGYPLISLDNVNGELGGDLLCQAIERRLIRLRRLGASDIIEIENHCSILANGNNLRISGDATRRTLLCNLDANMERPETRTFDTDPVLQVLADRGSYIAACLTIVRAYLLAGMPGKLPPLASFGDWSDLIRSALGWLGCADSCVSIEAARRDDPELNELREVIGAWKACLQLDTGYTARSIMEAAEIKIFEPDTGYPTTEYRSPELRDVLLRVAGDRGGINTNLLGKWLLKFDGRIIGGLRLSRDSGKSHDNVAVWVVRRI